MAAYCTQADVFATQPPGSFSNPGRLVAAVRRGQIELDSHGLSMEDQVTFEGDSIPFPLESGLDYYAIPAGTNRFMVSDERGGSPIPIDESDGDFYVVKGLPWNTWIAWASAIIDEMIPHLLPLETIPQVVRHVAADLTAQRALQFVGGTDIDINAHITNAQLMLQRWAKSVPIKGADRPRTTSMGCVVGRTPPRLDTRGWRRDHV